MILLRRVLITDQGWERRAASQWEAPEQLIIKSMNLLSLANKSNHDRQRMGRMVLL